MGVPGELYIGGDGLALGYLNRPELTRERFVEVALDQGHPTLLYKTGDLGRWRSDGLLVCLGRTDSQVKVRGYRIELGEIEAANASHPGIRQVVVLAREDRASDVRPAKSPAKRSTLLLPSDAEMRILDLLHEN